MRRLRLLLLVCLVFSARGLAAADQGPPRPSLQEQCGRLLGHVRTGVIEFDKFCTAKTYAGSVRGAKLIANAIDKLPAPVGDSVRSAMSRVDRALPENLRRFDRELLRNLQNYSGDFKAYYNLVSIGLQGLANFKNPAAWESVGVSDSYRRNKIQQIESLLDSVRPPWKNEEDLDLLVVDDEIELYSARAQVPAGYYSGAIVVMKANLVVGEIRYIFDGPRYIAVE